MVGTSLASVNPMWSICKDTDLSQTWQLLMDYPCWTLGSYVTCKHLGRCYGRSLFLSKDAALFILYFISSNPRTNLLSAFSLSLCPLLFFPPSLLFLTPPPLLHAPPSISYSPSFFSLHKNFLSLYNRPDPILNPKDTIMNTIVSLNFKCLPKKWRWCIIKRDGIQNMSLVTLGG